MGNKKGKLRVYHPELLDKLVSLMENGALDCEIFAKLGICKDTFYRWLNEVPEFKEAYEEGQPKCEAWWCDWGKRGMRGEVKGFNFNAWISFMNNKFKWAKEYRDGGNTTTNISVGNINVLQHKTREGLVDFIKTIAEKHSDAIEVSFEQITDQSKPVE